jgi:hypothetical protein
MQRKRFLSRPIIEDYEPKTEIDILRDKPFRFDSSTLEKFFSLLKKFDLPKGEENEKKPEWVPAISYPDFETALFYETMKTFSDEAKNNSLIDDLINICSILFRIEERLNEYALIWNMGGKKSTALIDREIDLPNW